MRIDCGEGEITKRSFASYNCTPNLVPNAEVVTRHDNVDKAHCADQVDLRQLLHHKLGTLPDVEVLSFC